MAFVLWSQTRATGDLEEFLNINPTVMTDGHVEKMGHKQSVAAEKLKRFWYPADNAIGPGGMNMAGGLRM